MIAQQSTHLSTLVFDADQTAGPAYGMFLLMAGSSGFWAGLLAAVLSTMIGDTKRAMRMHLRFVFTYWLFLTTAAVLLGVIIQRDHFTFSVQWSQLIAMPFCVVGAWDVLHRSEYLFEAAVLMSPVYVLILVTPLIARFRRGWVGASNG